MVLKTNRREIVLIMWRALLKFTC